MSGEDATRSDKLLKDYKDTFGTPHGRRVLADLQRYSSAGVAAVHVSSEHLYFLEGMRSVFWRCFHMLTHEKAPSPRAKTPPRMDFDVYHELERTIVQ